MKKQLVYALLAALIALLVFVGLEAAPKDNNAIQVDGVIFQSVEESPLSLVPRLAEEKEFVVSAEIHEPVEQDDSLMFNGLALFLVVLTANHKEVVQLLRVVDESGLSYCLTNYGDLTTEARITAEQCREMLSDPEKVVVLVDFPDLSLKVPMVTFSEKKIVVESNSAESINNASFTVLRAMFNNADEVLAKSNSLTKLLG
jgi:hypothetical protein